MFHRLHHILFILLTLFIVLVAGQVQAQPTELVLDVDTTEDDNALTACTEEPSDCSLRGAITRANQEEATEILINVPEGVYILTILDSLAAEGREVDNVSGDLNLLRSMTIIGAGPGKTIVEPCDTSRCEWNNPILTTISDFETPHIMTVQDIGFNRGTSEYDAGISNEGTNTLNLVDISVMNTRSDFANAGISNYSGTVNLVNSVVGNNYTMYPALTGVGISNVNGFFNVVNSTVSNNNFFTAEGNQIAGGIYNTENGQMNLLHSTVTYNGGHNIHNDGGIINLGHTVVFYTKAPYVDLQGQFFSEGYNLIGTMSNSLGGDETGNIYEEDPLLGGLADRGGQSWVNLPLAESPLVDAGDPNFDPNSSDYQIFNDQRGEGFPRVVNDLVDIGAVELQFDDWQTGVTATPTMTNTATPTATNTPTSTSTSVVNVTPTPTETTDANATATPTSTSEGDATLTPTATTDTDATVTPTPTPTDAPSTATATPTSDPLALTPTATQNPNGTVMNLDGTLDNGVILPTFRWTVTDVADWYQLVITTPDGIVVFDRWFPAAEICDGLTCTFTPTLADFPGGLLNGIYIWLINEWRESTNEVIKLGESSFTVNVPAPAVSDEIEVLLNSARPILIIPDDPGATWFQIWIGPADYSRTDYIQWVPKADMTCEAGLCKYYPFAFPPNGNYEIWMQTWGPAGYATPTGCDQCLWNKVNEFTLDFPPAGLVEAFTPTVSSEGTPTFTWKAAEGATWYQFWTGTAAPEYGTVHLRWHEALLLGCDGGGTCVLTLDNVILQDGVTYEWWLRTWGPGGIDFNTGVVGWNQAGVYTPDF
ncbi:MAG: hypothetical protein OHK0046_09660 [Anaerolineae bacterium]